MEVYKATDHGLEGLQRIQELEGLPDINSIVDNGHATCDFSLCNRFVLKHFGGLPFYGFIIGYNAPYYEVYLIFIACSLVLM
jgi:hypothetical protein